MRQISMLIGNQKLSSSEEKNFLVCNPANGKTIASVASASVECVQKAINAAKNAFPEWSAFSVEKRCEYLLKAAELLEKRKEE